MALQQNEQLAVKTIAVEPEYQCGTPANAHASPLHSAFSSPPSLIAPVIFIPIFHEKGKSIHPGPDKPSFKFVKPALDIALTITFMPLWLPLCLLIALCVWLEDGGNPLFFQNRIGKNGRKFRIWKFRTMVPGADRVLREKLLACPDSRREWNAHHKLKNDPRITAAGKLLRRFSLDELPQLVNVLLGHMSLIGPRPLPRPSSAP